MNSLLIIVVLMIYSVSVTIYACKSWFDIMVMPCRAVRVIFDFFRGCYNQCRKTSSTTDLKDRLVDP